MSKISNDSIILIKSAKENKANVIGTGFAFYRKQGYTYLITCAHVVEHVGGEGNVLVNGEIPAVIIAIGNTQGFDFAVLRIEANLDIPLLKLKSLEKAENRKFQIPGYYLYAEEKKIRLQTIEGVFGKKSFLTQNNQKVIAWELLINKGHRLHQGYSGAPVIDLTTGSVSGVATNMEKDNTKGLAISVEALKEIWPEVPSQIFEQSKNSKISPRYLIYSSIFALFIGFIGFFLGKLLSSNQEYSNDSFAVDIINKDEVNIENVSIETAKDRDVPCKFEGENVYSCGQGSKPIKVSITVKKVQISAPPLSSTTDTTNLDVHIINKDGVNIESKDGINIENVDIETAKDRDVPCKFDGKNVYSCGQVSQPTKLSIIVKKVQVKPTIRPSPPSEEPIKEPTKPFNLEEELERLKINNTKIIKKYKTINQLLNNKKWGAADQETYFLIFEIMFLDGKYEFDYNEQILSPNHVRDIPCKHLSLIDKIWKNASDDKSFSFSYQKKIYQKYEKDQKGKNQQLIIEEWGQELGWFNGKKWNEYKDWDERGYQASDGEEVPKGYFPLGGMFITPYSNLEDQVKNLTSNKAKAHADSLEKCDQIQP
ncbi:GUN4 domain-containing protein [Dapis sp. BLCC M126]|uniref:GUN4 domain-containing protein n=1 Tax=Dapis sp. BLCC M126 TaxID=3400189 RepID=UPI003CEA576D